MLAIQIKNLDFSYDENSQVLHNFNLDVEEGKFVAIIGHNGSGKSTLARLLMGLLRPEKGEIKIFNESLSKDTLSSIRKKIGIVFQNPDNQFISSTVEDDIAFGLENRMVPSNEMKEIIVDYAKKVGMEEFLNYEPTNLSGGQKQRVAIAGVLCLKPKILILDEATSMLDPRGRVQIRELISLMREKDPSLTVLSITHDVEEAFLADEIVVLNSGEVIAKGTPEEVFKDESKFKEIQLDVPFICHAKNILQNKGHDVSKIKTIDDLAEFLCILK